MAPPTDTKRPALPDWLVALAHGTATICGGLLVAISAFGLLFAFLAAIMAVQAPDPFEPDGLLVSTTPDDYGEVISGALRSLLWIGGLTAAAVGGVSLLRWGLTGEWLRPRLLAIVPVIAVGGVNALLIFLALVLSGKAVTPPDCDGFAPTHATTYASELAARRTALGLERCDTLEGSSRKQVRALLGRRSQQSTHDAGYVWEYQYLRVVFNDQDRVVDVERRPPPSPTALFYD